MTESSKLLADYVKNGSEPAFRELVRRYVDLVYSAAARLVEGDAHLARDIAQMVFVDLARKAGTLSPNVLLGGWLHRHTCFVAATVMRSQRRRQSREREAVEMNMLQSESHPSQIGPILDDTINQLGARDRAAILLRFYEQRDFRSVGQALGTNEDAARMRVNRALEKLHQLLKARGVTSSAAVLTAALTGEAITAAPAGLAAGIATAALAGTSAGTGTTLTLFKLMSFTKLQSGVLGVLVIAGATTLLVIQHQTEARLRDENLALSQQIQKLKADNEDLANQFARYQREAARAASRAAQAVVAPGGLAAADSQSTNFYARLQREIPKLTVKQVESYLKDNRRNAASLLAAFRTTGDKALLEEAMKNFPNDPEVAFEAAFKNGASPEEKRQWLDAFEKSDPDNALANYLSAREYLKAGQGDQAIQELLAASAKPQFQDYSVDRVQNDGEAYLSAGYSAAEAKVVSSMGLTLPQLSEMKQLGLGVVDMAAAYQQSGDSASAQSALQMVAEMGQRYGTSAPGQTTIGQLVAIFIQRAALGAMDPNSPYGNAGQTVQNQLDQLTQQRAAVMDLGQQFQAVAPTMSEEDYANYKERWLAFGEQAAEQWAIGKYAQP